MGGARVDGGLDAHAQASRGIVREPHWPSSPLLPRWPPRSLIQALGLLLTDSSCSGGPGPVSRPQATGHGHRVPVSKLLQGGSRACWHRDA